MTEFEPTSSLGAQDRVLWRQDVQRRMGVSSETMRRWIKAKKLPAPDVALSRRTMGWRQSTLKAHGINLP